MARKKGSLNKPKPEPGKTWDNFRLSLLNGKEITVEYREDVFEEIWGEMTKELEKNGIWFCGNWDNSILEVDFLGTLLDYIDMKKVIGII